MLQHQRYGAEGLPILDLSDCAQSLNGSELDTVLYGPLLAKNENNIVKAGRWARMEACHQTSSMPSAMNCSLLERHAAVRSGRPFHMPGDLLVPLSARRTKKLARLCTRDALIMAHLSLLVAAPSGDQHSASAASRHPAPAHQHLFGVSANSAKRLAGKAVVNDSSASLQKVCGTGISTPLIGLPKIFRTITWPFRNLPAKHNLRAQVHATAENFPRESHGGTTPSVELHPRKPGGASPSRHRPAIRIQTHPCQSGPALLSQTQALGVCSCAEQSKVQKEGAI